MRQIDVLLDKYGESHLNLTNKLIHWVCVPAIMFSLLILLFCIPFFMDRSFWANWAMVVLVFAWIYYARLSLPLLFGFVVIGGLMLWGIVSLYTMADFNIGRLALWAAIIFVVAWIGQFIGHKIEGKKPSFLEDIQFLLIGPAWLMHFVFKKMGIQY
jgi:uncharacterized membrane protein YGL010W